MSCGTHVPLTSSPWLIALAGAAGSGKSTLSRALGRQLCWPVINKDDIKDILYGRAPDSGALAYDAMFNVARCQLLLGLSVICDSPLTGGPWHAAQIAEETGAVLAVIECRCTDDAVWRERINARKACNLPAHHQTDWDTMQARRNGSPVPAQEADGIKHRYLVVNTLTPVDILCERVVAWLAEQ